MLNSRVRLKEIETNRILSFMRAERILSYLHSSVLSHHTIRLRMTFFPPNFILFVQMICLLSFTNKAEFCCHLCDSILNILCLLECHLIWSLVLCYFPGRILNRFSKDIGYLDSLLPWTFVDFIQVSLTSAGLVASAAAWEGHFMPG